MKVARRSQATTEAVTCLLISYCAPASACMVCTSNLSYNGLRFTALWVLIFLCWYIVLLGIKFLYRSNVDFTDGINSYKRGFTRYLILLVILYFVAGMHLGAILFLPLIMVWLWIRYAHQLKAASQQGWKSLFVAHWVVMAMLALAIPISWKLPRVIGEPDTRVTVSRVKHDFQSLVQTANTGTHNLTIVDPFARTTRRLPILGWLVMNNSFYYPGGQDNKFQVFQSGPHTMVWSRGPDSTFNINSVTARSALETSQTQVFLASLTYDPTNGIVSPGDVWHAR